MRAKLRWGIGESAGEEGWIPAGQPNFDPCASGRTVAHDLLEHGRPTRLGYQRMAGSLADELQALGVLIWGRGQAGTLGMDPGDTLAYEWEYHSFSLYDLPEPPRHVGPLREGFLESWIQTAVRKTRHYLIRESIDQDWDMERRRNLRDALNLAVQWTRIGVQRGKRRYRGMDPGDFAMLFDEVAQEGGKALMHAGEEGDFIRFSIDKRTREVQTRLDRLEDRYA